MAIGSYRYSINKRLPLHLPSRLTAVAVIPSFAEMPSNHGLVLHCTTPLKRLAKLPFLPIIDGPSAWSPRHLRGRIRRSARCETLAATWPQRDRFFLVTRGAGRSSESTGFADRKSTSLNSSH